ncbi:MAG: hypothetical protein V1662_01430 [Candidatus Omnitrophota bacterium]
MLKIRWIGILILTAASLLQASDFAYSQNITGKSNKILPSFVNRKQDPWAGKNIIPGKRQKSAALSFLSASDNHFPTTPSNVVAVNENMNTVLITWDASEDPESGISYYVFGVGTTPGEADIKWWQVTYNPNTSFSPLRYECAEGDTIYVSVQAVNGAGVYSETAVSNPVQLKKEVLGKSSNNITIAYADYGFDTDRVTIIAGWTPEEIARFEYFTSRMIPIIKDVYGPPSHNFTVTFVKDLAFSGSNIYFPGNNELHTDGSWYPQLLTHELVHAFRDNVMICTNQYGEFDTKLSGFEEGFAQAVSYVCMNKYIELYPDDPYVNTKEMWLSDFDWDYDFQNVEELSTEDFWSSSNGTLIYWYRYEMAAAGMRKIQIECPDFYRQFNQEWYARLNADHNLFPSRELVVDIISSIVPKIEGVAAEEWINQQYVFDCRIHPGKKIWVRTQHYPHWWYAIYQTIHYYETFSNGSDWAYLDEGTNEWIYYSLNGSSGKAALYDFNDNMVWDGNLRIEPVENPPDYYGYGAAIKHLINVDNDDEFPADTYIGGLHATGLYKMEITFDETTKTIYRVMGDALVDIHGGVLGGIIGAQGGTVYINHEGFPEEEGMPVVNGAFFGQRSWAGVLNSRTGLYDTVPGKLHIKYVNQYGEIYHKEVNIDRGGPSGNHIFLLDFTEKTPELTTLPPQPVVIDEGDYTLSTTTLQASWSVAETESDIQDYSYAIGTSPYANDILDWTITQESSVIQRGLNLLPGNSYYFCVKARNNAGLWSEVGCSDGIKVISKPKAVIDSIIPNPVYKGKSVTLSGHGESKESDIVEYSWRLDKNDILGSSNSLTFSASAAGTHTLFLKVRDSNGIWSEEARQELVVLEDNKTISSEKKTITGSFSENLPVKLLSKFFQTKFRLSGI